MKLKDSNNNKQFDTKDHLTNNKLSTLAEIRQLKHLEEIKSNINVVQKRYRIEDAESRFNQKISLPTLPTMKKVDLAQFNLPKQYNRLPKLEAKSEVPIKYDQVIHYTSATPERVHQSPDRQLSLNKKRLLARSWSGGQYAYKSKAGCLTNKTSKTNQDAYITNSNLGYWLWGVCDGHGVNGHLVSHMITKSIPKYLEYSKEETSSLKKAFELANKDIWDSEIDTQLSGSTTVLVLLKNNQLWTANVGDSRAILCRKQDGNWKAIQITRDHKPNVEDEKQRILSVGGRIESQKDYYGNPIGPERVWLQFVDAPGLAMTRSMGDKLGAQAGVIAIPEIFEFTLTPFDICLVIASDGVWEYLSNEDVMNIVTPYIEKENIDLAADRLLAESINAWKRHSLARDDITCIVIYFSK